LDVTWIWACPEKRGRGADSKLQSQDETLPTPRILTYAGFEVVLDRDFHAPQSPQALPAVPKLVVNSGVVRETFQSDRVILARTQERPVAVFRGASW
jgi:hypothetical protein